jgi:hypothetical protein
MKLDFNNRYLMTAVLCAVWFLTALIIRAYGSDPTYNRHFMIVFFGASLITFGILSLYRSVSPQQQRRRQIESFISDLDNDDLLLLRERLVAVEEDRDGDGEYESIEALLDQQKRKR